MINKILMGIMKLIIKLVSVIMLPIDNLISSALPDLQSGLNAIGGFLDTAFSSIGWCISLSGISSTAISLIVMYFTFKLTMPLAFYLIKLAIKWYDKLKP